MPVKRVAIFVVLAGLMLAAGGCAASAEDRGEASPSIQRGHAERRGGPMHRMGSRRLYVIGQSRRALPGGTAAKTVSHTPSVDAHADAKEEPGRTAKDSVEGYTVETLAEGTGPKASAGSSVTLRLHGRLQDGTTFQQLDEPAGPWPVDRLMPGLARTLDGMAVGERRRVTIPPSLAYGNREIIERDTGEVLIPAGATLVYDVELVAIEGRGEPDAAVDEAADAQNDPAPSTTTPATATANNTNPAAATDKEEGAQP